MPSFTTAADVLRRIFAKLNDGIPNQNTGVSLFGAWSSVLGGTGRTEYNIITSISDILSVMERLDSQIRASSSLDDFLRSSAIKSLDGFRPLFGFASMNNPAYNYKNVVSPSLVGHLGIIGLSLKDEYAEPKLSQEDSNIIISTLNEVRELLKDADLPADLRVNLNRHIEIIIWWLTKPEMVSLQDILEKSGSTMVLAKQIEERTSPLDTKERGQSISAKISYSFGLITNAMGFMVRNADNIEKIERTYNSLLNGPPGT